MIRCLGYWHGFVHLHYKFQTNYKSCVTAYRSGLSDEPVAPKNRISGGYRL